MKVLMVDSLVGNDYSLILCRALKHAGVDIHLITVEDRPIRESYPFPIKRWAPSKDPAFGKLYKSMKYIRYLMKIFFYVLRTNTRIIHFQFLRKQEVEALFLVFLKMLRRKITYTAHNVLPHENGRLDYFSHCLIYTVSDSVIVHSGHIKEEIVRRFGICKGKLQIIPHGNFDNYLPKNPISQENARKSLGLGKDDNVLLFFGFIRPYKGLGLLLEAFDMVAEKNRRLSLLVAGKVHTHELEGIYRRHINRMKSSARVYFCPGFVPAEEIPLYFTASDIVVLPYKKIDHSGILHLAYSFGKPVITTRVGDFAEIVSQDKTGYVLERNDSRNLARTIHEAITHRKRLQNMGERAMRLSATKYSWSQIAQDTSRLYQSLLRS